MAVALQQMNDAFAALKTSLGGAVDGKRVIAHWPGLEFARLYQNRDLAPTTDFRAVAKGVLSAHLAIPQDALASVVFSQSAGVAPMKDLLRA